MTETKETVIDGAIYALTQLPAMRSMKLLPRLAAILAPALSQLGHIGSLQELKDDPSLLAPAFAAATDKLTPSEFESIIRELLWSLRKDKSDVSPTGHFDTEFAGKPALVFQLLGFAFSVNYTDFTKAALGGIANLVAGARPAATQSGSPTAASIT